MPAKAAELRGCVCELGEVLCDTGDGFSGATDELGVVRSDFSTGARRAEVSGEAFAAPRQLDEEHRLAVMIAHRPSKAQFGTNHLIVSAVADGQLSLALEIVDEDIIACPPRPLVIDEMFVPGCSGRVLGEVLE